MIYGNYHPEIVTRKYSCAHFRFLYYDGDDDAADADNVPVCCISFSSASSSTQSSALLFIYSAVPL